MDTFLKSTFYYTLKFDFRQDTVYNDSKRRRENG